MVRIGGSLTLGSLCGLRLVDACVDRVCVCPLCPALCGSHEEV